MCNVAEVNTVSALDGPLVGRREDCLDCQRSSQDNTCSCTGVAPDMAPAVSARAAAVAVAVATLPAAADDHLAVDGSVVAAAAERISDDLGAAHTVQAVDAPAKLHVGAVR